MLKILVITDEKKSSINQCKALIYEIRRKKKLNVKYLLVKKDIITLLPNILLYLFLLIRNFFKEDFLCDCNLIISCGRISAPYNLLYKRNTSCKSYHILDPYLFRNRFDKIILPRHDLKKMNKKDNLILTDGTLVNRELISSVEAEKFRRIIPYNNIVSCFVGGDGKSSKFSSKDIEDFLKKINKISKTCKVVFCFSRRTNNTTKKIILDNKQPKYDCFDFKSLNPYWFLIENSRAFIVTQDSVSMISDVVSTGKPVYIIPIKRIKKKIKIFNNLLRDRGLIREFNGKLESWKYKPLKESVRVSEIICKSL